MLKNLLIIIFVIFIIAVVLGNSNNFIFEKISITAEDSCNVCLFFAGDVTFANHFEKHVKHNYDYPFAKMGWFGNADITMVNLENPLTTRGTPVDKQFNFRALPEYIEVLKRGGIDLVTIANNHIYDYSSQGLFDTIDHLKSGGIKHIGAGKDLNDARKPVILDVKGLRIGFLAYYGLRKHSDSYPATDRSAGTALRKLTYIKKDIQRLKNDADFIVVNFHWGIEKENQPGDDQILFAHHVIDYGADLIVGHHPHVLQGIEIYKGKAIAYSLGNFIFGGNSRKTYQTAVLQVNISNCDRQIFNVKFIPVQVDYWQPYKLQHSDSLKIINDIKKYSSIFDQSIF